MKATILKFILTATVITTFTVAGYSQVVASISGATNFASYNTIALSQLSYDVLESIDNVQFESIDYSASSQNLALETVEEVQFITIYKDGEVYLKNMPVFASSLTMSMQNYEVGDYELHISAMGKLEPTIIQIAKN